MIVFVSYGMPYDLQYLDDWPTNSDFPLWATNALKKPFYTDCSEFSNNVYGDTNRHSVSNFYYQMSQGTFEVIADYYPRRVVVQVDPSDTWGKIHQKALAQISNDVNWSLYDNRTNNPSFLFDNSASNPDGIVDFIVFCHRYSKNWPFQPSNNLSCTNANGFTGTGVDSNFNIGNGIMLIGMDLHILQVTKILLGFLSMRWGMNYMMALIMLEGMVLQGVTSMNLGLVGE